MAIAADARGVVARSVRSLAALPEGLPRAALVGGLAVMVRLYEAHRATTDFDEVTEGRDATIDLLISQGAVRTSAGVLLPDLGVQLDLLDAEIPFAELAAAEAALETDEERRGWQLAMVSRYSLETAVPTDIFVLEHGEVVASVHLPVAIAGALVAMKAHAASAPDRPADKAAGDVYDAYRLVRAWGPSVIASDLSRAPVTMLRTTALQLQSLLRDDVERTAHRLRRTSVPGVSAVGVEQLEAAGAVVDLLEPFLHWD